MKMKGSAKEGKDASHILDVKLANKFLLPLVQTKEDHAAVQNLLNSVENLPLKTIRENRSGDKGLDNEIHDYLDGTVSHVTPEALERCREKIAVCETIAAKAGVSQELQNRIIKLFGEVKDERGTLAMHPAGKQEAEQKERPKSKEEGKEKKRKEQEEGEKKQKPKEDKRKQEEEEEKKQKEAEKKRQQEEEDRRKQEAEKRQKEAEKKRQQEEEDRKKQEAEKRQKEAEKKRQQEEEDRRKQEAEKRQKEAEVQQREAEMRRQQREAEMERQREAEMRRQQREAEMERQREAEVRREQQRQEEELVQMLQVYLGRNTFSHNPGYGTSYMSTPFMHAGQHIGFYSSNGCANGRELFRGPRGGEYYLSSGGYRQYV